MRYIGRKYPGGKNGEILYPGPMDPMQTYEIDCILELCHNFLPKYACFTVPFLSEYK